MVALKQNPLDRIPRRIRQLAKIAAGLLGLIRLLKLIFDELRMFF